MLRKALWRGGLPARIRTLLLLMSFSVIQLNAQIELVKDVLLTPSSLYGEFSHVHEVGDVVYFVAENALWMSDSEGNTTNLRTFGFAKALMNIGDRLVFVAADGVTGAELWTSDGTSEGTVVLRDISPGNPGSDPEQLTLCNGMIFFVATTPANGKEVWRTDGTPSGTFMVKDIMKGGGTAMLRFSLHLMTTFTLLPTTRSTDMNCGAQMERVRVPHSLSISIPERRAVPRSTSRLPVVTSTSQPGMKPQVKSCGSRMVQQQELRS